jgi:hypothetical protein
LSVEAQLASPRENVIIKNDVSKAFGTTTGRFIPEKESKTGPGIFF